MLHSPAGGEAPLPQHIQGFGEIEARTIEIQMVGQLGDIARGSMGMEVTWDEATATLHRTVEHLVPVAPFGPKTCMDDGEAAGALNGVPTPPRAKMAGGSAMADWMGDELTRFHRARRGELQSHENQAVSPLDRLRLTRRQRILDGTVEHAGAHVRPPEFAEGRSGCGMADRLLPVQHTIVDEASRPEGDRLAEMTTALMRVPFSHEVHAGVVTDARRLASELEAHNWSGLDFVEGVRNPEPGAERLNGPSMYDDDIEVTVGEHAPDLCVVNYTSGTIDRDTFVEKTGRKVLWIDEAAVWEEAQLEATNPANMEEVCARYQAIMTANVAAGVTLGGPQLHVGTVGRPQPPVLLAQAA
jgi:hypothetical protein